MFFLVLLLYLISSASSVSSSSSGCPSTSITVTALILPPYVIYHNSTSYGIAIDFVRQSIKKCFRSCNLPPVQWNIVNTSTALKKAILSKSTDIAFPIVPSMEQEIEEGELDLQLISNVYNSANNSYVFENLIGSPGMSFIIHTNNFNKKARQHIIDALLEIWPIVVFCILLAGMSGIFVWAVEYQGNRSQFPKNFFSGSYEGFWWAFVTMTTVGYGDKTPKSICGRFFGVLWILVGLVIIAMFTASATNALDSGMTYYSSGVQGKRIGVLATSEAGSIAIRNGAIVTEYPSFKHMHDALEIDLLDGLLIDRYQASHLLYEWKQETVRVIQNMDVETHYKMVRVIGRNNDALGTNECFTGRIKRHERLTQKFIGHYVKPVKAFYIAEHSNGIFSGNVESNITVVAILFGIFLLLVVIGAVYQFLYRRYYSKKRRKQHNSQEENIVYKQSIMLKELGETVKVLSQDIDILKHKLEKLTENEKGGQLTNAVFPRENRI